jgi:hypothetical protein
LKQFTVARSANEGTRFKIDDDDFWAKPPTDVPGGALLDLTAAAVAVVGTEGEERAVAIGRQVAASAAFLRLALEPKSVELLERRLRDPEQPITMETVQEVTNWLLEDVYSGRPTEPPKPSGNGRLPTGPSSTAGARARKSTPSKSRPTAS